MNRAFKVLCSQENDTIRPRTITHLGRDLTFKRTCGQVLDSSFDELCDRVSICFDFLQNFKYLKFLKSLGFQALGASDYLQISQYFHTVLIRDVPQLNLDTKSQARRFITLIDTLYDNKVRVCWFRFFITKKNLISTYIFCRLLFPLTIRLIRCFWQNARQLELRIAIGC